jgi:hypothetical protein
MLIDERRFSFIPPNKWKTLSKQDRKLLGSYKSYYRWYNKTINDIDSLKQELQKKKIKKENYLNKMKKLNYEIDHLRNDYHFSWSVSKLKKKNYYNGCISRRGHLPKSFALGSPKLIEDCLSIYYKSDKDKIDYLNKVGWKMFIRNEMNDRSGKGRLRNMIVDFITTDPSLQKITLNRNVLFPIKH